MTFKEYTLMKKTINKKSKEHVVKKSSLTKKTKEHLVQKTSRTVKKITVTGRNVQEVNKWVNQISDSGTVFKKKTLNKKSKEPVIRKSSRILKNITLTDERDDNKSGTTDTKTGKKNACYKKVKKILK